MVPSGDGEQSGSLSAANVQVLFRIAVNRSKSSCIDVSRVYRGNTSKINREIHAWVCFSKVQYCELSRPLSQRSH